MPVVPYGSHRKTAKLETQQNTPAERCRSQCDHSAGPLGHGITTILSSRRRASQLLRSSCGDARHGSMNTSWLSNFPGAGAAQLSTSNDASVLHVQPAAGSHRSTRRCLRSRLPASVGCRGAVTPFESAPSHHRSRAGPSADLRHKITGSRPPRRSWKQRLS